MPKFFSTTLVNESMDAFEDMVAARRKTLKPVDGLRMIELKCCATCKFIEYDGDGGAECVRPNGKEYSAQDIEEYSYVCNRYKRNQT